MAMLILNSIQTSDIHSASEPYTEEQEISQERIDAWLEHFGMNKFQSHCSGHARGQDLLNAIKEINAKMLFPIHTEHAEAYSLAVPSVTFVRDRKIHVEINAS
jgi:mRNA degradation ribonuclease J1/J2